MYFNIKCMGKLPGLTNEFEGSLVFETGEFERPKFDCTILVLFLIKLIHVNKLYTILVLCLIKLNMLINYIPYLCYALLN